MDWYVLLTPLAVLALLMLFPFVGCTFSSPFLGGDFDSDDPYEDAVEKDIPLVYYRLQETGSTTVAVDRRGVRDATYQVVPFPLDAGDPAYRSTAVPVPDLELGVQPSLLQSSQN